MKNIMAIIGVGLVLSGCCNDVSVTALEQPDSKPIESSILSVTSYNHSNPIYLW